MVQMDILGPFYIHQSSATVDIIGYPTNQIIYFFSAIQIETASAYWVIDFSLTTLTLHHGLSFLRYLLFASGIIWLPHKFQSPFDILFQD